MAKSLVQEAIKEMHTTMQTLGRFAIIGGTVFVGLINVILFQGVETLSDGRENSTVCEYLPLGFDHSSYISFGYISGKSFKKTKT